MTQHVVLGIEGDPRLLVIDTVNMAVQAIQPDELSQFGGLDNLRTLAAGREAGEHRVRGIDIAVAVSQQPQAVSAPFVAPPRSA